MAFNSKSPALWLAGRVSTIGRTMNPYQFSVTVKPEFLADQSDPDQGVWSYSYSVSIRNSGSVPAQLIARHWIIMDGTGHVDEVQGLGVVGHQPLLAPGQRFEYTSGCALTTPVGTMKGSYQMVADDGLPFDAPIDEFVLSMPRVLH